MAKSRMNYAKENRGEKFLVLNEKGFQIHIPNKYRIFFLCVTGILVYIKKI